MNFTHACFLVNPCFCALSILVKQFAINKMHCLLPTYSFFYCSISVRKVYSILGVDFRAQLYIKFAGCDLLLR